MHDILNRASLADLGQPACPDFSFFPGGALISNSIPHSEHSATTPHTSTDIGKTVRQPGQATSVSDAIEDGGTLPAGEGCGTSGCPFLLLCFGFCLRPLSSSAGGNRPRATLGGFLGGFGPSIAGSVFGFSSSIINLQYALSYRSRRDDERECYSLYLLCIFF